MALSIAHSALERSGHDDAPQPLNVAVAVAVDDLVRGDGLLERPIFEPGATVSAELGVRLRNTLRHKLAFLGQGDEGFSRWKELVTNTFAGILDSLPNDIAIDDIEDADSHGLTVALIDLINSPAEVIERILVTWLTRQEPDASLFHPSIYEQLLTNYRIASGIDPEDSQSRKSLVFPTKAKFESPRELVDRYLEYTPFAVLFREPIPIKVPEETWFEHCHIMGGTGHGKTQLLQKLIHENLISAEASPRSIVVIDSQGDLIDTIVHLECFDPNRSEGLADRLIIIDPSDVEHPPALNLFDANLKRVNGYSPADRERIMAGTIELYEYLFGSVFGAELTQKQGIVFSYLARLMLTIPGATIITLRDLLENGEPFRPYMEKLEGSARHFFESEFFDRSFAGTKQQLRRRLWGVFANPALERLFSHPTSKIDLFSALNRGSVVLINTAKDLLKQSGCEVLGRFAIAMLGQAALERATLSNEKRTPALVFVDEAQDYVDEQVDGILTQARKYRMGLVLAHQTLDQLSPKLRSTIAANTSIKFVGGLAAKDARAVAEDMRTSPSFIQGMRKGKSVTEFACFIKNATPCALRVKVPLGAVEAHGRLSDSEYEVLCDRNREMYCWDSSAATYKSAPPAKIPPLPTPREGQPETRKKAERQGQVTPPRAVAVKPERVEPPPAPRIEKTREEREHIYLQNFIRKLAQDRGFQVATEEMVLDGKGRVDLALSKSGERIAVEVSVSTSAEHELGNVLKCLSAGFDKVCVVSSSARHLAAMERYIRGKTDENQHQQIHFLLPDGIALFLDGSPENPEPSEQTIRGYRVRVTQRQLSNAESRARRDTINQLISESVRTMATPEKS